MNDIYLPDNFPLVMPVMEIINKPVPAQVSAISKDQK